MEIKSKEFITLCVITTVILVLINIPNLDHFSNTVTSNRVLSHITYEHVPGVNINQTSNSEVVAKLTDYPKLIVKQSDIEESSSIINTSIPSNNNLHLRPPNQTWASSQMDTVFSMLGYVYHEPNNWHDCQHPATTYFFKNINTIFTGVPKSGCSNWLEALLEAEGTLTHPLKSTKVFNVHGPLSEPHRMNYRLNSLRSIHEKLSFVVVRNPWTRMVSGYRDKLSAEITQGYNFRAIGKGIVKETRGITDKTRLRKLYPTFEEYLRWLVTHEGTDNPHFMPQHKILCIPSSLYEFIVPLEYSDTMNSLVWSKIHSTAHLLRSYDSADDPRQQSSAKRARKWFLKIDQIIIDQLYDLYKEDFALLNYSNFTDPDFPLPIHDS